MKSKLNKICADENKLDLTDLREIFYRHATENKLHGDFSTYRVLNFMAAVCSVRLDPNLKEPFVPMWQRADERTFTPEDINFEQGEILAEIVGTIKLCSLRARVADLVWFRNRKKRAMADLAIDSYVEQIELLREASEETKFLNKASEVTLLERTFQIISASGKKKNIPACAKECLLNSYDSFRDFEMPVHYTRVADLVKDNKLKQVDEIAANAVHYAERLEHHGVVPDAVRQVWDFAAKMFTHSKKNKEKNECEIRAVKQMLLMRDNLQPMAKASWTKRAILRLRQMRGCDVWLESLKKELREYQAESLAGFATFTIPLDLKESVLLTLDAYGKLDISDGLKNLAIGLNIQQVSDMEKMFNGDDSNSSIYSLFPVEYVDEEGQSVAQAALNPGGKDHDQWLMDNSFAHMNLVYTTEVGGYILPAIQMMNKRFLFNQRHFHILASQSSFVPPDHEHIFSLGLTKMFHMDFCSALLILVPQFENSINYVLKLNGFDTSVLRDDSMEDNRGLGALLISHREELTKVFGVDLVFLFDILFIKKGGPSLRHNVAHGRIYDGECFAPSSIYACWIIFRLVCLPLIKNWEELVAIPIAKH